MTDKDKLDDIYKKEFDDFELPVSEKLLLNIKQELNIPNERNKFYYKNWIIYLSIIVAVVAGMGACFIYISSNKNHSQQIIKYTNSTIPKKHFTDTLINKSSSDKLAYNDFSKKNVEKKYLKASDSQDIIDIHFNKTKIDSAKSEKSLSKEESHPIENSHPIEKNGPAEKKQSKHIAKKDSGETNESNPIGKNGLAEKKQSRPINKNASREQKESHSIEKSRSIEKKQSKKITKTEPGEPNESNPSEKNKLAEKEKSVSLETNKIVENNKLNASNLMLADKVKEIVDSSNNLKSTGLDSLNKSIIPVISDSSKQKVEIVNKLDEKTINSSTKFFVDLNGGPSFAYRKISGSNSLVQNRNANEKQLITYNVGIDVGAIIKNKFIMQVGLAINNKGEKYNFLGQEAKFYIIDSAFYDTVQHVYIADTIQLQSAIEKHISINKYQFISIPILVGYQFTIKEKWFIEPSAGITFNYLIAARSSWVDPETHHYVDYNKNNFKSVTISGKIKINIGMNITDKWSVSIQPGYTRFLQSIYKKEDNLKLIPYSYDLNIGLRYKF